MRRTAKIITCLTLGAAMTVGVAWACAWVVPSPPLPRYITPGQVQTTLPDRWPLWTDSSHVDVNLSDFGEDRDAIRIERAVRLRPPVSMWSFTIRGNNSMNTQTMIGYGFPLAALWRGRWDGSARTGTLRMWNDPAEGMTGGYSLTYGFGGLPAPGSVSAFALLEDARYPLRPLYFGFTFNTLFYAALLYAQWSLIATFVRLRRLARGKCPTCKYPLGPSPICTECGTKIPGRAS